MTKDELIGEPQEDDKVRLIRTIETLEEAYEVMLDGYSRTHIQTELVSAIVSLHLLLDKETKELIKKDLYE